jgi:hypothetical protein
VVTVSAAAKGRLAADRRAAGVATDRLTSPDTVDRAKPDLSAPGLRSAQRVRVGAAAAARDQPRPGLGLQGAALGLPPHGLAPAVADTGLDYTHSELGPKVAQVIDLTVLEGEEPICKTCSASPTRTWRPSSAGRPTATGTATAPGSAATP